MGELSRPHAHAYNANPLHDPLLTALTLPSPEIESFKGDVERYRTFVTAFDARVGQKPISDHDKLYFLDQYLTENPKELIAGCFHNITDGYREARSILEAEYGHPHKLVMVFTKQIACWPLVKADDAQGLQKFSLLLMKCMTALEGINRSEMLDHPTTLLSAVEKLPPYLRNKWREKAHSIALLRAVCFSDLTAFVTKASQVANDPVFGKRSETDSRPRSNAHGAKGSTKVLTLQLGSASAPFAVEPINLMRALRSVAKA